MKQVILKIDDSAYEKFMGMVSLCPQVEVVCESGITDVMNDRDQCMVYAIQTLRNNHVFRFGYDYTWVMMDWTFTDMDNPSEILRRKNVVRQFLSAFGTAKRGILNKILNNCFTAISRPKKSFYLCHRKQEIVYEKRKNRSLFVGLFDVRL